LRDPRSNGRAIVALLALAIAVSAPAFARPVPPGVPAAEVEVAADAILCDCGCHPQSVHACACGRAEEMWSELAAEVASGGPDGGPLTGEQVIAKWVAERGETILLSPEASGFNLVAWLGPIVLLIVAAATLFVVLRRLAARRPPTPAPAGTAAPAIDPAYLERIRKNVEELQ
jgi:cytochrome c-type biogenesis protein CcmH/NrfF